MRRYLTLGLLVMVVVLAACSPTPTATPTRAPADVPTQPAGLSGELTLAGSTTVQPLAQLLADAFMEANPGVVIDVAGGGSSAGVTAAGEGTADIGNVSRNVKDSEFQQFPDLQVFTIAYDGIAIVTNPGVQLGNLTMEQVQAIFAGEITNFREVGGPDAEIVVVSREEGSGTRGAFEELVMKYGGTEKLITANANLQSSNGAVRTVVAETPNTIAYLSFGFLDDSVRAVPINGVEATVDNVLNGSYPIYRPLNMVTNGPPSPLAQAFLDFILSADGQDIVAEDWIPVSGAGGGAPTALSGELTLAGSTTVQPLAQLLADAFMEANPGVVIDVAGGGSSAGVTAAGEGTADIGNVSRNVKDSEFQQFPDLQVFTIAYDGIAIVTNPGVQLDSLTMEQVQAIFAGEITNFREVGGPDAEIVVVSREEGSGTRGAFEELVMKYGGTEKLITANANLQSSNGAVRTVVAETPNTIAYLSFGFLDDSVRAVPINGVEATVDNVLNGSYPIYRPLNMVTNGPPSPLAQAFLGFVLSPAGQAIVAEDWIPVR